MSVTDDSHFNNRFKHVPVPGGPSYIPLAKQESRFSMDSIFQLFSVDSETSPLDSFS